MEPGADPPPVGAGGELGGPAPPRPGPDPPPPAPPPRWSPAPAPSQAPQWQPPAGWPPQDPPGYPLSGYPLSGDSPPGYPPPGYPPPGYPPPGYPPGYPPPGYPPPGYPPPGWGRGPHPGWYAPTPAVVGSGRFRSRTAPELIDAAVSFYRRNFLLVISLAALVAVPFALASLAVNRLSNYGQRTDDLRSLADQISSQGGATPEQHDQVLSSLGVIAVLTIITLLLALIASQAAVAALSPAVSRRYLGRPATVGGSLRVMVRRLGPLLLGTFLELLAFAGLIAPALALAFTGGDVTLIIFLLLAGAAAAVVLGVRWLLMPQAVVIEGIGGAAGLRRSWALTRTRFWRTVGFYLLLAIVTGIVSAVVQLALTAAFFNASTETQLAANTAASAITRVFVAPVSIIGFVLYYYDVRIRAEAFDLEMLAADL